MAAPIPLFEINPNNGTRWIIKYYPETNLILRRVIRLSDFKTLFKDCIMKNRLCEV